MSGDPSKKAFAQSGPKKLEELPRLATKFVETIGIIFDATGFYKTNRSVDYVVKLRVFDDSLDPASTDPRDYEPYLMVFLYFPNRESIIRVPKIGDVIVLQSFLITLNEYKEKVYVTASSNQSCSDWQILDGADGASTVPLLEGRPVSNRKYHFDEFHRIKELRNFARTYFGIHELAKMRWHRPPLPANIDRYQIVQMKDVDVLAKLVAEFKTEVRGVFYQRLLFRDQSGGNYLCEVKSDSLRLEEGRVYKLRSFSVVQDSSVKQLKKLIHYEHSAFLLLPEGSADYLRVLDRAGSASFSQEKLENMFVSEHNLDSFEKVSYGRVSLYFGSENEEADLINGLIDHYPSLEDYNLDDVRVLPDSSAKKRRICSVIRKKHQDLPVTPLSELQAIMASVHARRLGNEDVNGRRFRVRVGLRLRPEKSSASDIFQLHLTESGETFRLNKFEEARRSLENSFRKDTPPPRNPKHKKVSKSRPQEMVLFMSVPLMATDKSCREGLLVYVLTEDGKSQDIFELWNLFSGFADIQRFIRQSEDYRKSLEENFRKLETDGHQFDLILEFVTAVGADPTLRIIDTKFWLVN